MKSSRWSIHRVMDKDFVKSTMKIFLWFQRTNCCSITIYSLYRCSSIFSIAIIRHCRTPGKSIPTFFLPFHLWWLDTIIKLPKACIKRLKLAKDNLRKDQNSKNKISWLLQMFSKFVYTYQGMFLSLAIQKLWSSLYEKLDHKILGKIYQWQFNINTIWP